MLSKKEKQELEELKHLKFKKRNKGFTPIQQYRNGIYHTLERFQDLTATGVEILIRYEDFYFFTQESVFNDLYAGKNTTFRGVQVLANDGYLDIVYNEDEQTPHWVISNKVRFYRYSLSAKGQSVVDHFYRYINNPEAKAPEFEDRFKISMKRCIRYGHSIGGRKKKQ